MKEQFIGTNLDYIIEPTFENINRLLVLSSKTGENDPTRSSLDIYYMPLVEIKDLNALIDNKPFFSSIRKKTNKRMKNLPKYQETILCNRRHIRLFVSSKININPSE